MSAVESHSKTSIQYSLEATGVIHTDLYEVYFAILPTGDFVYYTINKKTNRKGNYCRVMKLNSIYNHLIKLEVIDENTPFEAILSDAVFGVNVIEPSALEQQPPNSESPYENWGYISLDSSMNVESEFHVINGSSIVFFNTEESQKSIGNIHFKIYNSNLLGKYQLLDAADASSGDEQWLMSTFIELFDEELELLTPKFLMLNMISIKHDYRNRGYGKVAIKELIQLCKVLDIEYIVLKPSPIEDVDFSEKNKEKREKDIERLVSFYKQLDFDLFYLEDKEPIAVFEVNDAE